MGKLGTIPCITLIIVAIVACEDIFIDELVAIWKDFWSKAEPLELVDVIPAEYNVYFRLYTDSNNTNSYELITSETLPSCFRADKPLAVFIHGYLGSAEIFPSPQMKDAYLSVGDNVIIVDWSEMADNILLGGYPKSSGFTLAVGNKLGELLEALIKRFYCNDLSRLHVVGHSLGAHVASYAAQWLAGRGLKIPKLTGLDPALPLFELPTINGISSSDADFVQIIHSGLCFLGEKAARGHADFWPNGGGPTQPEPFPLTPIVAAIAGHFRSTELFVESITSGGFSSVLCDSYTSFQGGLCNCAPRACDVQSMGERCSVTARGSYYLNTNSKSPFSLY